MWFIAGSGKMVLHYQLDYFCPEPFSGNAGEKVDFKLVTVNFFSSYVGANWEAMELLLYWLSVGGKLLLLCANCVRG